MNTLQFQTKILCIQDNMFNFAMLLTGNQNDANDLLQDTILKVLDNEEKYIDNINFTGWVLTIMRNLFINNCRKVVRIHTIIDQTEDLHLLNLPQNSGFESPESSCTMREIDIAIDHLNSNLRMPLLLFLAGYKYNEIAKKLTMPLGTVKSRIFFARQELRKSLRDLR